jgi:hypothetical protein
MPKKRYVVEMDMFLWAEDDLAAKEAIKKLVGQFDTDSDPKVHQLHEVPWGMKGARKVELNV